MASELLQNVKESSRQYAEQVGWKQARSEIMAVMEAGLRPVRKRQKQAERAKAREAITG